MRRISLLVQKYASLLVAMSIVLSIVGGLFAMRLTLQSNLAELLPDSFESVKALSRIKSELGGVGNLRVVIESSEYAEKIRFAEALEQRLAGASTVNYIDYKNAIGFYQRNGLLLLSLDELHDLRSTLLDRISSEKQRLNPLMVDDLFSFDDDGNDTNEPQALDALSDLEDEYSELEPKEYYVNADSSVMVLKVIPSETSTSLSFVARLLDEVRAAVDEVGPQNYAQDMVVYYGGNFKNRLDEYDVIKDDIVGTAVYGLGGVFLLILLYFRRLMPALLITMTLLFSLTWTFGLTYLVLGSLNTITGFLFVILFGLGIDYGIHAFARYAEERRTGLPFNVAIDNMICHTGKALTTTALTTSAAFFSLTLMDFKGFSDLGFISGVGILFALAAMVIVLPSQIMLLEKYSLLKLSPGNGKAKSRIGGRFPLPRPILTFSLLLTIGAAYAISLVAFEYDFTNLRAITEERKLVGEKTKGVFRLSESPAVVLADSSDEIPGIVDAVTRIIENVDDDSPTVSAVRSVASLIPSNQTEKLEVIREMRSLVDREADGVFTGKDRERLERFRGYLAVDEPFSWDDFPDKDKQQFVNKRGEIGNFVFIYPKVALRNGKNAIDFRDDVGILTTASGKVYHASSSNIILADMLTVLLSEGKWAVALTLAVVFFVVLLDFRSLRAALLVLSPLVLGILWVTLVMYIFEIKWNLFNIVVIPSVIGIGVDNGVHIFHRYSEEGQGSLMHVLRNTGVAILMTTLTTMVGYSGLTVAHHPGLNSIGKLALVGIGLTFLTAVVVLPALLQFAEERTSRVSKENAE